MIEYIQANKWGVIGAALFIFSWCIQLFYLLFYFLKAAKKNRNESQAAQPVSVVISARNEEKNLMENVPLIMDQNHREFELVVVNDSSWDDTAGILKALEVRYPNIRIVNLDEEKQNMQGKKFALTLGIKAAKYETILLTDADCVPLSQEWITLMSAEIHDEVQLVLGVSLYHRSPGWFNKVVRFDTLMIASHYVGFARAGKPYMGVGRNLCYTKELFFKVGGFKNHYSIASGDDDLFVNQVATSRNTTVITSNAAQTVSQAKQSWGEWFAQKRRHFSTTPSYKTAHKNMLMLWPLSFLLMYAGFATALVFQTGVLLVSGILFVRYIIQIVTLHKVAARLEQGKDIVWFAPFLEIQLHVLNLGLYITNLVRKPKKWN